MKQTLLLILLLPFIYSCNQKPKTVAEIGGTIIDCRFSDMALNNETPQQITSILQERLRHLDGAITPTVSYNESDSVFHIEIPGLPYLSAEMLLAHGRMNISEICQLEDLIRLQNAANSKCIDSLLSYYNYTRVDFRLGYMHTAILTDVSVFNIHHVDSIIEVLNIKSILPDNIVFKWGMAYEKRANLYIVKNSSGSIDLNRTHKSSKIENSDSGYPGAALSISLNEAGARKFETLTELNIGQPLAITVDDFVLSAPTVSSKIEGGSLSISGAFDHNQIAVFRALLNGGVIASQAKIASVDYVERKKEKWF
ncbi:SecDF P1 head subdomain-containing protein [Dysgonomonas sp. ZJ279]|uniref:SecDF P1 head subdomain-containing protein n=1 Tax=Dysgonomonas sp. ZJ279 TaxID=2709796 RepID=UPI0013ED089D|nr:hypothetical protein [Dysgonomonas sp. ZJ279]